MDDQKIIDTIAEALERDAFGMTTLSAVIRQATVALAALRANGIAVVKLPDETTIPTGWGDDCLGAWPLGVELRMASRYIDPVSAWPNGQIALPDGYFMPVAEARSLAVALLSAAERAE